MGRWEINGNLQNVNNYEIFESALIKTFDLYVQFFGTEIMSRFDLYVDNVYTGGGNDSNTGHTPIITPVLGKFLIIKLGILDFSNYACTIYQFAHELCHYVFYSLSGLDKKQADDKEESICCAMSLFAISQLCPERLSEYENYTSNHEYYGYSAGYGVIQDFEYNGEPLSQEIIKLSSGYARSLV